MNQRDVFIDWIEDITHWTTKMDMTFKWNCTQMNARRLFVSWMRKHLPGSTYMYSIEEDPNQRKVAKSGQGLNKACHIHAISDTKWDIVLAKTGRLRKDFWQDWKSQYGRNIFLLVHGRQSIPYRGVLGTWYPCWWCHPRTIPPNRPWVPIDDLCWSTESSTGQRCQIEFAPNLWLRLVQVPKMTRFLRHRQHL